MGVWINRRGAWVRESSFCLQILGHGRVVQNPACVDTVKGSMGTSPSRAEGLQRQSRLLDRVDQGFVDRWEVKVHGDPHLTRAEMAGILACVDKVPCHCNYRG